MQRLLDSRIPAPDHFLTKAAQILFDVDDNRRVLPEQIQKTFLKAFVALLESLPSRIVGVMPLLGQIDQIVLPLCSGPIRRKVLEQICALAPRVLFAMPQAHAHVRSLSRAYFISGILHPQALKRIEAAIRAEGIAVDND